MLCNNPQVCFYLHQNCMYHPNYLKGMKYINMKKIIHITLSNIFAFASALKVICKCAKKIVHFPNTAVAKYMDTWGVFHVNKSIFDPFTDTQYTRSSCSISKKIWNRPEIGLAFRLYWCNSGSIAENTCTPVSRNYRQA